MRDGALHVWGVTLTPGSVRTELNRRIPGWGRRVGKFVDGVEKGTTYLMSEAGRRDSSVIYLQTDGQWFTQL